MTEADFRGAVLSIAHRDLAPLIESVLETVQAVQASERTMATAIEMLAARLRRLEIAAMVDDALN